MKKRRQPRVASLDLLEASVHLLRSAPATALLAYYLGSAPFILGLLFFWSDMSRSAFAERHLVGGAIAMSLLFVWMKCWQSVFANILRASIAGESPAPWSLARAGRLVARQLAIQPSGLFLLPIALIIAVPFGWLYTFYQNVVALGDRGDDPLRPFMARAWKQATFEAMENQFLMAMLLFFGMFVWLNIFLGAFAAPAMLKMLLGIETPFTLSMRSVFNTTFLAVITGVAYLATDPLAKAAYVLRCFHGESRSTGEDLLVGVRRFTATALLLLSLACAANISASEAPPPATKPSPARSGPDLDRAIDEVLKRPHYTWRSPRENQTTKKELKKSAMLERIANSIKAAFKRLNSWLDNFFKSKAPRPPSAFSLFSKQGLMYGLILLVAAVMGYLLYLVWRIRFKAPAQDTVAVAAPAPDLADENITAEQLPEDGWVRLGVEMLERGDLRLALRAFYLASLAHLAERNLIALARFKSNRDYELELLRRSHALPEVAELFSVNVSTFDRIWYGLHEVTADLVESFRARVERIKSC